MERSITWRCLDMQVRGTQQAADALWRARHDGSDFSIIGDNCWGGFIYRHLRRPYLTPFAGLFLEPPCFLRLLEDLRGYLSHPPQPVERSKYETLQKARGPLLPAYPIGVLGEGIELHFLHYRTWEEALDKWNRRTARIRWDRLYVKYTDRGEPSDEHARRFMSMPYERKLYLTNRTDLSGEGVVCLGGRGAPTVVQGIWGFRRHMDVPDWLCRGRTRGGAALRYLSRSADAFLAAAADWRERARIRGGGQPEQPMEEALAESQDESQGAGCRT